MNKASSTELQLHFSLLESGNVLFQKVFDVYNKQLVACLLKWYKMAAYKDPTLAHEAVFETIRFYCDHPRTFNPEHGSLRKYLEIYADKSMQKILERENISVDENNLDHVFNRYFDNELDIELARMILHNEKDMAAYISLLGIGSYRMEQQHAEVKRQTERISKKLDSLKDKYGYLFNQPVNSSLDLPVQL